MYNCADFQSPSKVNNGLVTFNSSTEKLLSSSLELQLYNDDIVEPTEFFVLTFTLNASKGIQMGKQNKALVVIEDTDGKYNKSLTPLRSLKYIKLFLCMFRINSEV